ncbi:hypothetical protein ABW19_dt0207023 [Dactylella cylindrospora]|nr:hypothetical protein ABW19_dt0207023 [Dactylella cylindrospora]
MRSCEKHSKVQLQTYYKSQLIKTISTEHSRSCTSRPSAISTIAQAAPTVAETNYHKHAKDPLHTCTRHFFASAQKLCIQLLFLSVEPRLCELVEPEARRWWL